jgi:hypothetical protein
LKNTYFSPGASYFISFLRLYGYRYIIYSVYFWSGINEVLINYDRYLVLSNKNNLFNRKNSFKVITFITGFISFLLFVPNLFAFQITLVSNETNTYDVTKTNFGNTNLYQLYLVFILNSSNILSTLFLIITSIKLALEAKHFSHNHTSSTRQNIRRKQLEMNIFKLTFTMSIIFTLVRFNQFFHSFSQSLLFFNIISDYEFLVYYSNFWYILLVLAMNSNIFILLGFNKKFRFILFDYAKKAFIVNSTNITN